MRVPRPFVPQSFSQVQTQKSRALSIFVAIAHSQLPAREPTALSVAIAAIGAIGLLVGLGIHDESRPFLLVGGSCALLVAIFSLWARERGSFTFGSEEQRRDAGRARLLFHLDRKRQAVGLDQILMPDQLAGLEAAARVWEKIGHTLSSATWREQPELTPRVERAAFLAMLELLSLNLGSLVAEGVSVEDAPALAAEAVTRLDEIAAALDAASNALESYQRPVDGTAGAPPGEGFPEIQALNRILDGGPPEGDEFISP